ncbi:MAG: gamma-glutamyltransferase [Flavobacteriaceae bacterium]|nr:gamma-glutamyltransferase [Flavobacteriaceae bacterium]|tara:strand:+ start:74091 stop:75779 length:1689 start_codon:yes stop_codon:yes gene_type:complete
MKNVFLLLLSTTLFGCQFQSKKVSAAVVSARVEASKIGIEIMNQGGNAFDAMVATDLALSVCYPNAGNIGGGGFLVYRDKTGHVGSLDFREKAPSLAHEKMFLNSKGDVIKNKSIQGGLSVGVPGTVAGLFEVHSKLCTMPFEDLIQPAIDLARNGFVVTEKQAIGLNRFRADFISLNGQETFYARKFNSGDTIVNLNMAKTLEKIKLFGKDGFYKGKIADKIIKSIQSSGGIMTLKDLENYNAKWRAPLSFEYKNLKIHSMGLPSSGGICLAQIMAMIAPYDIGQYTPHSNEAIQLMVESERRSFSDRSKFLGDPDFNNVQVDLLLNQSYLDKRMSSFSFSKATASKDLNPSNIFWEESDQTTHYSIVDLEGNAVSVTTTLNASYGSKLFVEDGGFFLNNEMDDFSIKTGVANMYGLIGGESNKIAPNKRMLSSMSPTIVEENGELALILGSPGGSSIITSVLQVILNVFEFDMGIKQAVNAPRFHHQWLPEYIDLEPNTFNSEIIQGLTKKGYLIDRKRDRLIGRVDAIRITPDRDIIPAPDPRGDDAEATIITTQHYFP